MLWRMVLAVVATVVLAAGCATTGEGLDALRATTTTGPLHWQRPSTTTTAAEHTWEQDVQAVGVNWSTSRIDDSIHAICTMFDAGITGSEMGQALASLAHKSVESAKGVLAVMLFGVPHRCASHVDEVRDAIASSNRPQPPVTSPSIPVYVAPMPTYTLPPLDLPPLSSYGTLPTIPSYPGNGLGPTLCADGSVSGSAGSGTCSHHGGEAP